MRDVEIRKTNWKEADGYRQTSGLPDEETERRMYWRTRGILSKEYGYERL